VPRVAIVVTDGVLANAVFELVDGLSLANRYTEQQYGEREALPPTLDVRLVSASGEAVRAENGRLLPVDEGLHSGPYDLIYVAPFAIGKPAALAVRLEPLHAIAVWLAAAHGEGARLAASGSGVAVLARAGVLAGVVVPLPWWLERPMARLYPHLTFDVDRKVQVHDGLFLAGAHVGEPALTVRIIEAIMSPDVATWIERITGVDRYPDGPDPALAFSPTVLREDELVKRAAHWLQLRFAQKPQIADLSAAMAIHPRTLSRRFMASLGMTPIDYLQRLRIEAAKRMLARSARKVDRVGYLVGYSDPRFFKSLFRKHTGLTPGEYRRRTRAGDQA